MALFGRRRGDRRDVRSGDIAVYDELRNQALSLTAREVAPVAPLAGSSLVAVLMETGYDEAVVTLVGVADGSTSLYFSNGGGIIGAGGHEVVAAATRRWLEECDRRLELLSPDDRPPRPSPGETRFVAVTVSGLRSAGAPERELGDGGHALSPLFYAAQDVITQVRLVDESRPR